MIGVDMMNAEENMMKQAPDDVVSDLNTLLNRMADEVNNGGKS
jgi:hypothetical protein